MPTLYECSIIIPVYNLEKYLDPMITSLKEQDFGEYNVEIIFVLNNCTDRSEEVIRESGLTCRIINCTEQGCGPARNEGYDISKGKYIWFMDGDDWLLTKTAVKDALDKANKEDLNVLRIPFLSNRFHWHYFSMVWQYLLKSEFIEDIRFPSIQPGEDDAFMAAVLRKDGYSQYTHLDLPHTNRPLYFYNYLREGSNMYRVALGERI